jgi:hypothetical protein
MWSARISGCNTRDPLEQYHSVLQRHEALVRPRLDQLRQEVDATLSELRRLEHQHLDQQRQALSELRTRLRQDARFVLHAAPFGPFLARLEETSKTLPPALRVALPQKPARWVLDTLPLPLQLRSCELQQHQGYEEEHDCLRDLLLWKLHMGPLPVHIELERGVRLLGEAFRETPLVYQHQELAFSLEEHLGKLDLGEAVTRTVSREVAAVVLYATPILLEEPTSVTFSYP